MEDNAPDTAPPSTSSVATVSRPSRADIARIASVLGAVLLFQLIMVGSYVGAFHNPRPHDVPVAVVGPTPAVARGALQAIPNADRALALSVAADEASATRKIIDGDLYAALLLGAAGDQLLVASAASPSVADSLTKTFTAGETATGTLTVKDLAPLSSEDLRGVAPFYLVLSWVVGGYLGATVVGLLRGMSSAGRTNAWRRVAALGAYSVASGIVVSLLTAAVFGIVSDHLLAVMLIGSLVVFATAVATAALQSIFGMAGTAIVLILFVAFGNPASGGPVVRPLLPGLWRTLGGALIPGAGTDAMRAAVYFPDRSITLAILTLGVWAVVGVAVVVLVGRVRRPGALAELELQAGVAAI
jgi:hypothetical protein